jgi:predicted ATPase
VDTSWFSLLIIIRDNMALQQISIENFRAFREKAEFNFAPITILTGTNSSGKSSLTKAVLLLKESIQSLNSSRPDYEKNPLYCFEKIKVSDVLNIGNFKYWQNDSDKEITFSFPFYFKNNLSRYTISFGYERDNSSKQGARLKDLEIREVVTKNVIIRDNNDGFSFDIKHIWEKAVEFESFINRVDKFINRAAQAIENEFPNKCNIQVYSTSDGETGYLTSELLILEFALKGETWQMLEDNQLIAKDESKISLEEIKSSLRKHGLLQDYYEIKEQFFAGQFDIDRLTKQLLEPNKYPINVKMPLCLYTYLEETLEKSGKESDVAIGTQLLKKQEEWVAEADPSDSLLGTFREVQNSELENLQRKLINVKQEYIKRRFRNWFAFIEDTISSRTVVAYTSDTLEESKDIEEYLPSCVDDTLEEKLYKYYNQPDVYDYSPHTEPNTNATKIRGIIVDSIADAIENIQNRLIRVDYIPPFRNPMPHRFYMASESNNYFADLINKATELNIHTLNRVKTKISEMLRITGIADRMEFKLNDDSTINYIKLYTSENEEIDLADFGHGVSQLLPVIVRIAFQVNITNRRDDSKSETVIIEEPETNLHPALQSKLADLFVHANKVFGVQFIIETHSEYLIRRLQGMVVQNSLRSDTVVIYYFHHPRNIPEGESQVYRIDIEPDGALSKNFGKGFFDEAARLNIALYNFSKEQHN